MSTEITTTENQQLPSRGVSNFAGAIGGFGVMKQIADVIAESSMLPDSLLYDKPGKEDKQLLPKERREANAFVIVNQARQWDVDPIALAQGTSIIHGKVMYEGKIVAGVVNKRGGLIAPLDCRYEKTGNSRTCIVFGRLQSDPDNLREVEVKLGESRSNNGAWNKDPDQMLFYFGVRKWARKHAPSVMLGLAEDPAEVRTAIAENYDRGSIHEDPAQSAIVVAEHFRKEIQNEVGADRLNVIAEKVDNDPDLRDSDRENLNRQIDDKLREIESRDLFSEFKSRIPLAASSDELEQIRKDIAGVTKKFTERQVLELRQLYEIRSEGLETDGDAVEV